jgi:hypothetical protein
MKRKSLKCSKHLKVLKKYKKERNSKVNEKKLKKSLLYAKNKQKQLSKTNEELVSQIRKLKLQI